MNIASLRNMWLRTGEVISSQSAIHALFHRTPHLPNDWFVDGQNGSDSNDGRDPRAPLLTISRVLEKVQSGDTVFLTGNFAEEAGQTPLNVEDVTFIGVGNRPRHADAARDAKTNELGFTNQNSGASWRPPAVESGTTPLITVVHQGWRFENILFAPPTDAAAVLLDHSAEVGADDGGGSHAAFINCRFDAGQSGIEDDDGNAFVEVRGCMFRGLTYGIRNLSTGNAIPLHWIIEDNIFINNTNHILMSASMFLIRRNVFGKFTTLSIDLANGAGTTGDYNVLTANVLAGDVDTAEGYEGNTNDTWAGNFAMTVTGSAVTSGSTNILPTT